jgi:transposase-like protein
VSDQRNIPKKKRVKRSYTDTQKAEALIAIARNKGNIRKTSKELDIPYQSLNDWNKNFNLKEPEEVTDDTVKFTDSFTEIRSKTEAVAKFQAESYLDKIGHKMDMTLERLEELIPKSDRISEVSMLFKILSDAADKFRQTPGLDDSKAANITAYVQNTTNNYNKELD